MTDQAPAREKPSGQDEAKKDIACGLFGQRIHRQSEDREAPEPVPA
ncbi:MAG: hypothetical protein ACMUJI_03120 [Erythrobacter sp.]